MSKSYTITVNGRSFSVQNAVRAGNNLQFSLDGELYKVNVGATGLPSSQTKKAQSQASSGASTNQILSPMPGIVVSIGVKAGDSVTRGQTVCVIEAMKMENNIAAPRDGEIELIDIKVGQEVGNRQLLVKLKET